MVTKGEDNQMKPLQIWVKLSIDCNALGQLCDNNSIHQPEVGHSTTSDLYQQSLFALLKKVSPFLVMGYLWWNWMLRTICFPTKIMLGIMLMQHMWVVRHSFYFCLSFTRILNKIVTYLLMIL